MHYKFTHYFDSTKKINEKIFVTFLVMLCQSLKNLNKYIMTKDAKRLEHLAFFLDKSKEEFRSSISDPDHNLWSTIDYNGVMNRGLAYKIIAVYPRINLNWLLEGEGYIVNDFSEKEMQKQIYLLSVSTNKYTRIMSIWIQILGWLSLISLIIIVFSTFLSTIIS